jgi:hypothetical protein
VKNNQKQKVDTKWNKLEFKVVFPEQLPLNIDDSLNGLHLEKLALNQFSFSQIFYKLLTHLTLNEPAEVIGIYGY